MFDTREEWLTACTELLSPLFISAGVTPKQVRLSMTRPDSRRKKVIGECHYATEDNVPQIFISSKIKDSMQVLSTLAHELTHGYLPAGTGHKGKFVSTIRAINLVGKPTETVAGEAFLVDGQEIIDLVGEFPHEIGNSVGGKAKQESRNLKVTCSECSLIYRMPKTSVLQIIGSDTIEIHTDDGIMESERFRGTCPVMTCGGHPECESLGE